MEKYISELIQENNRVIIPNFGAFIISKENGVSILFNNFLSFNDGLLVNYVAEQKGIDTIVATDQVFEFVDNLKKQLDEQGVYAIEKLGVFKKDENGILRFQQAEDFGEGFVSKEPVVEEEEVDDATTKEEPQDMEEGKKETFLLDIDNSSEITEAGDDEKIGETPSEDEYKPGSEAILTIDNEPEEVEAETKKETVVVPKAEPVKPKVQVVSEKKSGATETNKYVQETIKEKKRKDIITFIIIAVLLVICIGAYFLFFNKPQKKVIKTIPVKVEKPVTKQPVVTDTVPKVVSKPEPIQEPVKPAVAAGKDFFIIVGSFKNEANAVKMLNKLKASGFGNAQIIPKGNMFLVSADSSPSYKKIETRQQEILENDKIESWLYKVR
ncbi:SPOR domain-containing protein [Plebeiibacterium marinum]|uniref:SPOR domain-containing protein n=1 Tax=Plebeiibacterium marinum TaxID=2992111 RepID=A0AAE3MCU6_9BACT|nr:SPOR domain-containing protein [Plebeiobacterium marinum]MCW3805212.1 SPOR domain-containing protein [Plebeiobacterium marinum]